MKANHTEAAELGDFLGNTAKNAMIGKLIAAPLKYAGDAWTKFSLANPNYYVPAEFGSAVAKLEYLDEIASGQLTTTSSRVAAQTTAAKLRKEIILKSGMDKSEILKFCGDGDDILAIIDEMDNVVGGEGVVDDVVTYTRVQGGDSKDILKVNSDGTLSFNEKFKSNDLNVSTGKDHAEYFSNKRGSYSYKVQFEVPKWLNDLIEENSIPQEFYKTNPLNQRGTAPKIVDQNIFNKFNFEGKAYELPAPISEWLAEYAKNAKIIP